jgi:RNA polymerase sigma-70 factor (ECF subfamily)
MPFEPASDEGGPAGVDGHPAWDDPHALLQRFSDRHMIQALQCLPEEIRWTLLLVDVEGIDHAEAAAILGVPVGTVKSRAHRGRRMLREALLPLAKELRLISE